MDPLSDQEHGWSVELDVRDLGGDFHFALRTGMGLLSVVRATAVWSNVSVLRAFHLELRMKPNLCLERMWLKARPSLGGSV